jgi:hypothetical protein
MQCIEFTTEESEVLREVLQHKLQEATVEVFRTDTYDYKQMLKHRREVLEKALAKFSAAPVQAGSSG